MAGRGCECSTSDVCCERKTVLTLWVEEEGNQRERVLQKLPPFLAALVDRLVAAGIYSTEEASNHVLINEYSFGAGIPSHQDGPLYLDR